MAAETLTCVTSTDGTQVAVWQHGSGPALVAVHGTTADRSRWMHVAPRLASQFTVYLMDRRGRGRSGDAASYSMEREAEDIRAVVRHVHVHELAGQRHIAMDTAPAQFVDAIVLFALSDSDSILTA